MIVAVKKKGFIFVSEKTAVRLDSFLYSKLLFLNIMKNIYLLVLSLLGALAVNAQSLVYHKPYLQNPTSNAITVMYQTLEPCHHWIEYGTDTTQVQMVRALIGGQEVCHDRTAKVRLEGLQSNTKYYYRVCTRKFLKNETYHKEYGPTEKTEWFSFKLHDEKATNFRMLILNDIHINYSRDNVPHVKAASPKGDYDLIIFNGDCLTEPQSFDDALYLIHALGDAFDLSNTPALFVRGNHEIRGAYSAGLPALLDNPGGKMYGSFLWGDTFFLILDCGEDKSDDHKEYYGLNDFSKFRAEETEFLKEVLKSKDYRKAQARILIHHIPIWGNVDEYHPCTELWSDMLQNAKLDVSISAHNHEQRIIQPGEAGNPCLVSIGDGPENPTPMVLEKKGKNLHLIIYNSKGEVLKEQKLK